MFDNVRFRVLLVLGLVAAVASSAAVWQGLRILSEMRDVEQDAKQQTVACAPDPSAHRRGYAPNQILITGFPEAIESAVSAAEFTERLQLSTLVDFAKVPVGLRSRAACSEGEEPPCFSRGLEFYYRDRVSFGDTELTMLRRLPDNSTDSALQVVLAQIPCDSSVDETIEKITRSARERALMPTTDRDGEPEVQDQWVVVAQPDYLMASSAVSQAGQVFVTGDPTDNSNPIGECDPSRNNYWQCVCSIDPDDDNCGCWNSGASNYPCPTPPGGQGFPALLSTSFFAAVANAAEEPDLTYWGLDAVATRVAEQTDRVLADQLPAIPESAYVVSPNQSVRVAVFDNLPEEFFDTNQQNPTLTIDWAVPSPLTLSIWHQYPLPSGTSKKSSRYRGDHGVFSAGLIHNVVSELSRNGSGTVKIELFRILSDNADGYLSTLVAALWDLFQNPTAGFPDTTPTSDAGLPFADTVIHLGLGVAIPNNADLVDEAQAIREAMKLDVKTPQWLVDDLPEDVPSEQSLKVTLDLLEELGATIVAAAGNDRASLLGQGGIYHDPQVPALFATTSKSKFHRLVSVAAAENSKVYNPTSKGGTLTCYANKPSMGDKSGVVVFSGEVNTGVLCKPYEVSSGCYELSIQSHADGDPLPCKSEALIGLSLHYLTPNRHAYWIGSSFSAALASGYVAGAKLFTPTPTP